MQNQTENEITGCILTWTIEKFLWNTCGRLDSIETPEFLVPINGLNTKWILCMYPGLTRDSIDCYIKTVDEDKLLETQLGLELSCLTADGKSEMAVFTDDFKPNNFCLVNSGFWNWQIMLKRRRFYFPNDNFTIRCRIWTATLVSQLFMEYVVVTKIEVTKCSFQKLIPISEVMIPEYEMKCFPLPTDALEVKVFREKNSNSLSFSFCYNALKQNIRSSCKLRVLNSKNILLHKIYETCFFERSRFLESHPKVWNLTKPIQLKELMEKFSSSDHAFTFEFDLVMTTENMSSYIIEKDNIPPRTKTLIDDDPMATLDPLSQELEALYMEKKYADVQLKLGTEILQAHKSILCSRSPVFAAMFDNDMVEKKSGVVEIKDVDATTLDRMLLFMYTGRLKDMNEDIALHLMAVADKYQVVSLKEKCSASLKKFISVQNACRILQHADTYDEKSLKSYAQEFISGNHHAILSSNEWRQLTGHSSELAGEIIHKLSTEYLNTLQL